MVVNREPTNDELSGKNQDTVHWPAKAYRNTLVDSDGGEITTLNPLPVEDISDDPVTDLEGKGYIDVGLTEVVLEFTGETKSIIIKADISNTGIIYIGKTGVGNDGTNSLTYLVPGDYVILQYNNSTNALYLISDTAAQKAVVGALK